MIKDTNPDHFKVDGANFIEYMNDPKISGFGNWMFANGFNSGVWASTNWISVKDRMPKSKTCVLVTVKTRDGEHVVLIARHVNAREVDSEDYEWQDAEIDWDYDEENDIYWVPECWYEGNFVEENTSWIIDEYADGIVTHWMPIPEPPKEEDNADNRG